MNKPIATQSTTNEILRQFNLSAKKSYGQNFIIDPTIVENIAEHSGLDEYCAVIEIGPGIGALTEQLAKRAKTVLAYEIDEDLIAVLQSTLAEYNNVQVIRQDFLELDLAEKIRMLRKNHEKVMICSNLPYYITTAVLMKIFQCEEKIDSVTVMMQKEVADHFFLNAGSRDYGAINIVMESGYEAKKVMKVSRTVFDPKPNVESAVIQFVAKEKRLPESDREHFHKMVKACFKQRRKSLLNNYGEYLQNREKAKENLLAAKIAPSLRAEALSLEQFLALFEKEAEGESV